MTTAPAYEKGKLYQIPVTDLNPDPDQPRGKDLTSKQIDNV